MMFEVFRRSYSEDSNLSAENTGGAFHSIVTGWNDLIAQFGGASFEHGLYRVIRPTDLSTWNARVAVAFPEFSERITCFSYDWLGRAFAVDLERQEDGKPGVVMFEPGTGEALEIPCNIDSFHNEELIEYGDAALASDFHKRWLANGGVAPRYDQCVGYRKPLFLGGTDELENLEVSDLDVYWHLMGQLILKAKGLPMGNPLRVSLS